MNIVGDQTTSASDLSITWSDDDYQNYSTAVTVDLSGSHPMRIESLDFPDIQVGEI